MKIAIVGSRNIQDYQLIQTQIIEFVSQRGLDMKDVEIVSGGAKGVDALAKKFAQENGCKYKEFPAEWGKYGKSAGYKRNELIWEYADCDIAFWDGASKGTQHSFKFADKYKKHIKIICVEQ